MEKTPYPNNTVTEPDLILRHVDYIVSKAAMIHPLAGLMVAMEQPQEQYQTWKQVFDITLAIKEYPLEGFPSNSISLPSAVMKLMDGIIRRAAILNPEATREVIKQGGTSPIYQEVIDLVEKVHEYQEQENGTP